MPLDTIIVSIMALAFFGGIIFLAVKNRGNESTEIRPAEPPAIEKEDNLTPMPPRSKERRKRKN